MPTTDNNTLPSQYQIGHTVILPATIVGVTFTEGKVEYTVKLDEGTHILVDSVSVGGFGLRGDAVDRFNREFSVVDGMAVPRPPVANETP